MNKILPEYYVLKELESIKSKYLPKPEHTAWERNVIDAYKGMTDAEIKEKVEAARLPFAFLMINLNIDYNLGAVVRVANAFGGEVFYYGSRKYDKRGATGTYHYTPVSFIPDLEALSAMRKNYEFVGLEQTKDSYPISDFNWSKTRKSLIVLGQESCGIQEFPDIMKLIDRFVVIKQRGSVRSLNTAVAAGIAAQTYSVQLENSY